MRIFITGGCGYIGFSLVQMLLSHSLVEEIILYDNLSRKNPVFFLGDFFNTDKKIKFVEGNILDNFTLKEKLDNIDMVIHLAGKVTTPFADHNAHEFDQVNHWGTACLVDAIESNDNIKHVVYFSTIGVYGNSDGAMMDESVTPAPRSFYGKSKLRGEKQVQRLIDKVEQVNIIRGGNVYGFNPCMRMDAVINRLMFDAHFKGRVHIDGDGNQGRAFLHINDMVSVMKKMIETPSAYPQLFNLTSRNLSINKIVENLEYLYPDLEKIYLGRHMKLRSVAAKTQYDHLKTTVTSELHTELAEIKSNFSF